MYTTALTRAGWGGLLAAAAAGRSDTVLRRRRGIAKAVPHDLSTADIADLDSPAGPSRS